MPTLTITAKGQVTLRKEVLRHLGVGPGDKIDVELAPGGKASVIAAQPKHTGSIEDVFGMLGPWEGPPVSLEEIEETIAAGWAGEIDFYDDAVLDKKKKGVRITVDTNVLLRALMEDHPAQSAAAQATLREADGIAIPVIALCELAWVLRRLYRKTRGEISDALKAYVSDPRIHTDLAAVQAGLAMLDAGGGFADGVIAHEGQRLGGEVLMTFDRKAVRLITAQGGRAIGLKAD